MSVKSQAYKQVDLYGGAITCDFPACLEDASAIREVPDTQELWLDADGFSSIVVDLCDRIDKPDLEAFDDHLDDILGERAPGDTGRRAGVFFEGEARAGRMPPNTPTYTLLVRAPAPPRQVGRANEPDFVGIFLVFVRLREVKTDVMVAINVPHVPGEQGYVQGSFEPEQGRLGALMESARVWRDRVLGTLEVREWGLFVNEEEDQRAGLSD